MENAKFKTLKCEDGKSYIFNHRAFKVELKRIALAAKKENKVASIEEYEEKLADKLAVTPSAIKQWKYGKNGVSDIDRVKEIARCLGLENYQDLLTQIDKEEKDGRDMNNNIYLEEERKAAREVFNGMIKVINTYRDTGAYSCYDPICGVPSEAEVMAMNDEVREIIQRARFDMPKETYDKLESFYYEIVNSGTEDAIAEAVTENATDFPYWRIVERKADEYFEELCGILKDYVR